MRMKKIIIFGAGKYGKEALLYFGKDNVCYFCDNNKSLWGREVLGKKVIAPCQLSEYKEKNIVILAAEERICIEMKYQLLRELQIDCFFNYMVLRQYLDKYGSVADFINGMDNKTEMYKLMYLFMEDKVKQLEEQIDFFTTHTNLKDITPATGRLRNEQCELLEAAVTFEKDVAEVGLRLILGECNLIGAIRHGGFVPWDDDMDFLMMREEYNKLIQYFQAKGQLYISEVSPYDEKGLYTEMEERLSEKGTNYELCLNGWFLKVFCRVADEKYVVLDVFPLDYYKESVEFSELIAYIKHIQDNIQQIETVKEMIDFYQNLRKESAILSEIPTQRIQYGLESGQFIINCKNFHTYDTIMPLGKMRFENYYFWTPHLSERYCQNVYGDIWHWPADAGKTSHGAARRYISYHGEENEAIYIDSYNKLEKALSNNVVEKIIIEKYRIKDIFEFDKIVSVLEQKELLYQIYS